VSLIKTRPEVRLYVPAPVKPGERVVARVVLDARRPVPVDRVTCTLEGTEAVHVGSGNARRSQSRRIVELEAVLLESARLDAGRTELRCAFDLPVDLPASYDGKQAQVRYVVTVDVDIPWWLDRTGKFQLVVARAPFAIDDPGPSLHATAPEGPTAQEPQLELGLDTHLVHGGETLRGRLALSNTAFNPYETAKVALVAFELVFGRRIETQRYAIRFGVQGAGEGEPLPFAMKLPDRLEPTTNSLLFCLDWMLEVEVDYGWRRTVEAAVPITVVPEGTTRRPRERRAPVAVGSARIRTLWSAVARATGLMLDEEADALRGVVGEVNVVVRREHRGSEGIFLIGELRYPDLGLDLDGGLAGSLRRIADTVAGLGGGVRIGDERWDRDHHLTGRDPLQVFSFVKPLTAVLLPLTLADADDRAMVLTRRDPGQHYAKLERFVSEVVALAHALPNARQAIVVPRTMAEAEASWRALATRLGGRLDRARMAVAGRLDDLEARITTVWAPSGSPLHTEIVLASPFPFEERDALRWTSGGLAEGDLDRLSERARTLMAGLTDDALTLAVERDSLSLWLPAPAQNADRLFDRLETLAAFGVALRGDRGPYR
jgi:hypothetical protein